MNNSNIVDDASNTYVTTFDNPFDYSKDYLNWRNFDLNHYYNTEAIFSNICNAFGYSIELPISMQHEIANRAINQMVDMRPGLWIRVTSEV